MNSTKINLKELNILDLDGKKISITFETDFLNKIKKTIKNFGGLYKLEKETSINYSLIHQSIKRNSFPLYILENICNLLKLDNIDKNVESYRLYHGKKLIKNPILNIKESPELTELAGHMLGDGFLTIKKGMLSNYTNTSKKLIEEVKNLCNKIFGSINLNCYLDKRFRAYQLTFPKIISIILSIFYPELLEKSVPKTLFNLPKEFIASFIRAFADDESCVTTSAIVYTQKDKKVLDDLRKLHLLIGFREENLTQVKRKKDIHIHNFSIIGKGLIYFYDNIGYKHPDKIKDLEVEVKRKNNKKRINTVDSTKKEITHFLTTPKTIKDLSALVGVQPSIIRKHMKILKRNDYVKIIAREKYKVPLWIKIKDYELLDDRRKDKIIQFLIIGKLSTLEISKRIGLGKDRLMVYLYKLKKENKINYIVKGRTYIWYKENES